MNHDYNRHAEYIVIPTVLKSQVKFKNKVLKVFDLKPMQEFKVKCSFFSSYNRLTFRINENLELEYKDYRDIWFAATYQDMAEMFIDNFEIVK